MGTTAVVAGRVVAGTGVLAAVALLPWLSGTDPALAVLRARSADQDPSPGQLAAVREQLGLDRGPLPHLLRWLGGLPRGDAGVSWVSGHPVLPEVMNAFAVSVTLMLGALVVTVVVAALLCARTLRHGARPRADTAVAFLAALPKFLLAALLATVFAVWLRWFPSGGWEGPASMVLPSLALGVPSGAVIGGLLERSLPAVLAQPWVRTWHACGLPPGHIARHGLRGAVAGVLPQLLPTVVALVGGAVAVEKIFTVPGLGRLALDAALARDLPLLQTATLVLVLLGVVAGVLVRAARRALLGPALRDGALPALEPCAVRPHRFTRWVACSCALVLLTLVVAGLLRDPSHVNMAARLASPSITHPLGTDALGRDLLARLGHGALRTTALALAVTAVSVLIGLLVGTAGRAGEGLTEVVSTLPAVLVGLLTTAVAGPSVWGAACAVSLVAWTPHAAQAAALFEQERATGHVRVARSMGAGRLHLMRRGLLPAVLPSVLSNAVLRLPTTVLVLASLGFLGLGEQPPAPEWGRLLSENQPYLELAPWTVLGPAGALVLLSVVAVSATPGGARRR
ncbi:ABC transporter permease subunit [Lentzea sp. NPDC004782]|uniref:ABC transporter permease subunit n=1 Tax=Lentzea sp. NPDC004782 TaxID=3154458 RepID=UPI0033B128DD